MAHIYIVLTNTGTVLGNCIKLYTKETYNHSSIVLDPNLKRVYSFGRKQVHNPFIGGFVREDFQQRFFDKTWAQIYRVELSQIQLEIIWQQLLAFKLRQEELRYNFLGLIGIACHQIWPRQDAYFCSQFIAYLLEQSTVVHFNKPCYLITPTDLIKSIPAELIFEGAITDYLEPDLQKNFLN